MSNAGLYVDYFGNGNIVEAFHPTLQMCYIQGKILIPEINLDDNSSSAYFDFDIPSGIQNPFLYNDAILREYDNGSISVNASTYYRRLSDTRWRIYFVGHDYIDKYLGRRHFWTNPIVSAVTPRYIYYGGYRG